MPAQDRTLEIVLSSLTETTTRVVEVPLPGLPAHAKPLQFVLLPPGTFTMGSPECEKERRSDEGPPTCVRITQPFFMARYETTQVQWELVMTNNPSHFKGNLNMPVESLNGFSRDEAMEFCARLTRMTRPKYKKWPEGYVFRLPTEAEWEYACRADTTTPFHYGNSLDSSQANFDGNYPYNAPKGIWREKTVPVGSFKPNAWGLYDMHGNVWELCLDLFPDSLPGGRVVFDPKGPSVFSGRVLRGGSWSCRGRYCRSADRGFDPPCIWDGSFGFRAILAPAVPSAPAGMVCVEGGSFLMGNVFNDGQQWLPETPVHEVVVDSFFLGRYEVTVAEFRQFAETTGYRTSAEKREGAYSQSPEETHWQLLPYHQQDDKPALQMSWNDAVFYCNWLSHQEGLPIAYDEKTWALLDAEGRPTTDVRQVQGYRLPTEAEWEFAARERGKKVRFGNGKDIAKSSEINFDAWSGDFLYGEKGIHRQRSVRVGSFQPNVLGIFDMSGNAWEWCTDCAADYPKEKRINPYVPGDEPRILRGGSMGGDAKSVRVFSRACFGRADHCGNSGFRLARTDGRNQALCCP